MRRPSAVGTVFVALGLILALAAPAAAVDPPTSSGLEPPAQAQVQVTVTGYAGGSWEPFSGTISCMSLPPAATPYPPISFGVGPQENPSLSAELELPYPALCRISSFQPGYPGDNAEWEDEPVITPWEWTTVQLGLNSWEIEIARYYGGEWPPSDDTWDEQAFEAFTVDRVFLNRYGAITVEGSLSCDLAEGDELAANDMVLVNVNWDAIQYVGRKTAIHASWDSGIATPCWQNGSPGPFTWQTLYPYPQGGVQWVVGQDGKFGTSTVHVDANASGGYQVIRQGFDPTGTWTSPEGSPVPYEADCEDNSGDGFCVASHAYYGWAPADLKPIVPKPTRSK